MAMEGAVEVEMEVTVVSREGKAWNQEWTLRTSIAGAMEGAPFPINTKPLLQSTSKRGLGPSLFECPFALDPLTPNLTPPLKHPHRLSLPCPNATRRTSQYGALNRVTHHGSGFFPPSILPLVFFFHTSLADDDLVSVLHIMDRSRPSPQHPRLGGVRS